MPNFSLEFGVQFPLKYLLNPERQGRYHLKKDIKTNISIFVEMVILSTSAAAITTVVDTVVASSLLTTIIIV